MKEIELINLRKPREKHFLQKNGDIIAKLYNDDVHFKKNGKYEEINNTLVKENEYYTNTSNKYKVYFNTKNKEELIKLYKEDNYIFLDLLDKNNIFIKKDNNISNFFDCIKYENILNNIDLEYQVLPSKIKENIIIKSKDIIPEKILFSLKTNLELTKIKDRIFAKQNEKNIFTFLNPYMIDANNNRCYNIFYNLVNKDEKVELELILDKEWLSQATYPVIIDPTIIDDGGNNEVYDTYIFPGDSNIDRNNQEFLKVGVERDNNNNDIINRSLIKFDLPTIGTGSQIIEAHLALVGYPLNISTYDCPIINVHNVTEPWLETNANWNSMNDKYDPYVEGSFECFRPGINIGTHLSNWINTANITNLVRKWYSGLPNQGIMLKLNEEIYIDDNIPMFYSKNNNIMPNNPKPLLTISYRNQNGLEDYMDYKEQNFSIGKIYQNVYNGNVIGEFNIGNTVGGKLPAYLKLFYNTNDVILENNYGFGIGYKLNFYQTIKNVIIDNISYLEYLDGDGTIHYFKENDGIFYDEDGLNLTIKLENDEYIMEDKDMNKKYFSITNSIAFLHKIRNKENCEINITYNNENKISKIVDAKLSEINLSYGTDSILISTSFETIYLNYVDGKIKTIITPLGETQINYNNNGIINSIIDIGGKKLTYEYYNTIPYRVKKVSEYGNNNTLGKFYNISYEFDSTTIIDNKNRTKVYTFNEYGNTVSISNITSDENLLLSYGKSQEYGNIINNSNNAASKYANKLIKESLPNKYVKNLLTNSSFEQNSIDFIGSINVTMNNSELYKVTGSKSLNVNTTANNEYIYRTVNVEKGKWYTFSGWFKNNGNIKLSLSYTSGNNEIIEEESEIITINDSFQRSHVSIFYPSDAQSDLTIKIYLLTSNSIFIDDIQLEIGDVVNKYNMLENSDFSDNLNGWIAKVYERYNYQELDAADYFEIVNVNNNNALKIKMNPKNYTYLMKEFSLDGIAGDEFYICFWYKNEGFIGEYGFGQSIANDVNVSFSYLDESDGHCTLPSRPITSNPNKWQFFSATFKAEKQYNKITLRFNQTFNANNLYITGLCLFKDYRTIEYDYDDKGRIIYNKNLNNDVENILYNKNEQMTKILDYNQNITRFEYSEDPNQLIASTSELGLSNKFDYTATGDLFSSKIESKNYIIDEISDYNIRLNGTNKYLTLIDDQLCISENCGKHNFWKFAFENEHYKIFHKIINNKYIKSNNNTVYVGNYSPSDSLFDLEQKDNGSYIIKSISQNKYIKYENNNLILTDYIENDSSFEIFIEKTNYNKFIEAHFEYTEDNKFIKKMIDSLGNSTEYNVNPNNGVINSIKNSKGVITNYSYNTKNQLTKVEIGNRNIQYNYGNNNLVSKIKNGEKEYNFVYDEFENNTSININNNITLINKTFEANNGNLTQISYGNGHTINLYYDDFDRIVKMTKGLVEYKYKYDNKSNLVNISSPNFEIQYSYDFAERLYEYKTNNLSIRYTYDSNNNIINKNIKLGTNTYSIQNSYDADNNLISTNFDTIGKTYTYDNLGRINQSSINNNYTTNYGYLTNGNQTSTIPNRIVNDNDEYYYKYDSLKNITHIYHNQILENKYYYDMYNQLIKEDNYILRETISYYYDLYGNLLKKVIKNIDNNSTISVDKYEYNQNWKDQLIKYNNSNLTYDSIGNLLSIDNNINLTWENGRELKTYVENNNITTYNYNDKGLRISKTNNGITAKYYLENDKIVVEERGNNVFYYMYNEIDNLIGFKYNENIYYYVKNLQGDIKSILDINYNIVANYEYDSWGNILSIKDGLNNDVSNINTHIANLNPFRYRGYYYDVESKMYYLNQRYYNPLFRRFISTDLAIGNNKDIFSCNLYAYVSNNPVNNVDPTGCSILSKLKKAAKKLCKSISNIGKKVVKAVGNFVGSIINLNYSTKTETSNTNGNFLASIQTGSISSKTDIIAGKNSSIIKINASNDLGNIFDSSVGVSIDSPHISVGQDLGFLSAETSLAYRNKNTTYSVDFGINNLQLYAQAATAKDTDDGYQVKNYSRFNVSIFIPLAIAAFVFVPEVSIPTIAPLALAIP